MYGIKVADLLNIESRKTRSMEKNPKDYGLEQQFCPWCENHRQKAPRHNNCPYRGCPCLKCKPLRDRYALDKEKSLKYKEKIQKKKDEYVMLRLKYGKGRRREPMKNYEKPKTRSDRQTAKKDEDDSDSEEERNTRASSSRKRKMAASDGSLEETKKSKKDTDNDENNTHSDDNDDIRPELPAPAREQDATSIRRNREYLNEVGDRPGTSWSSAVDIIEREAEEGVEDDDDEEELKRKMEDSGNENDVKPSSTKKMKLDAKRRTEAQKIISDDVIVEFEEQSDSDYDDEKAVFSRESRGCKDEEDSRKVVADPQSSDMLKKDEKFAKNIEKNRSEGQKIIDEIIRNGGYNSRGEFDCPCSNSNNKTANIVHEEPDVHTNAVEKCSSSVDHNQLKMCVLDLFKENNPSVAHGEQHDINDTIATIPSEHIETSGTSDIQVPNNDLIHKIVSNIFEAMKELEMYPNLPCGFNLNDQDTKGIIENSKEEVDALEEENMKIEALIQQMCQHIKNDGTEDHEDSH